MLQMKTQRNGTVSLLLVLLMVPLLGLLAFSVDYGFLLFIKTELQRTADQAAIAAVRDLTPDPNGNQDLDKVRETIRTYVRLNMGEGFSVHDDDIEIGRYNPSTIYGNVQLLSSGIMDTVRVTIRRDDIANKSVSLYFARLINHDDAGVVAMSTAVLQRARYLGPGSDVFPFTIEQKAWNRLGFGENASIYGDGRIEDGNGNAIPGNWGTVDIGPAGNSTTALSLQIDSGLTQDDLDSLYQQNRIDQPEYIDASVTTSLNGDTGLSSGLKHSVQDAHGTMKIAPVYKQTTGHGGNLQFTIVAWTSIQVVDSGWHGSQNSRITVKKSYMYDSDLLPVNDLSDTTNVIEGAYTSPVLIQ